MIDTLDIHRMAAGNPAVDVRKIEQMMAVRQAMDKAGVLKKADYRLSHPLGTGPGKPSRTGAGTVRFYRPS
jgi:hypothetical protein